MKNRLQLQWRGALVLLLVSMAGTLVTSASVAQAKPGESAAKVAVCHIDDGEVKLLMVSERGARTHLGHGDVQPGDPVPGPDGNVFDDQCRPVFPYAQVALDTVNSVRFGIDPACDPDAAATPCGPDNGGLLAPVVWDQNLAELALPVAQDCPVFPPGPEAHPEGTAPNIYLHWSPEPVSEAELVELAIRYWAEKEIQYDPLTGNAIRPGDQSHLSFKRLIAATRVGIGVRADCPNNRAVAFMILDPEPADGPVYPPLLDVDAD